MREIDIDELRNIQIDILSNVAEFCERKSLNYFLGYGTLIGAVRHRGYIPWDDDIDIIMPRPDYERFLSEFNNEKCPIRVVDWRLNTNYELPYAKVYDERTEMIETMYKPKLQFGVYIDVFPIDGYKESWSLRRIRILNRFLNTKKAVKHHKRSRLKNVIISIGKVLLIPFSVRSIIKTMNSLATKYKYDECDMVDSMFTPYCLHEMCPKSWISSSIWGEFEGAHYRIPERYDDYLRNIYGDYMKLPPLDKQVTHHVFKAWWKYNK